MPTPEDVTRKVPVAPGAANTNALSSSTGPTDSPRLVIALNTASTDAGLIPTPVGGPDIQAIFKHVAERLKAGLDACWASPDGSKGNPNSASDDEEKWARVMAEVLTGHKYGSPGGQYGIADWHFFESMLKQTEGCYPLASACQQLCTAALIGRGFTRADLSAGSQLLGIGAAPHNETLPAIANGGKFLPPDQITANTDAAVAAGAGPASMFLFFDADGKKKPTSKDPEHRQYGNNGADHIGFALRAHKKDASNPWNALQFFDTGALGTPTFGNDAGADICDYKWTRSVGGPRLKPKPGDGEHATFQGVLIPAPAPDLAGGTARMRRLSPLGIARLVIRKRGAQGADAVTWHTGLMRMHDPTDPEMNFSIARLLWSLRDAPFCDQWETCWEISIPLAHLLLTVKDATRSDSFPSIVSRVLSDKAPDPNNPFASPGLLARFRDAFVDTKGKVHVRSPGPQDSLPWRNTNGIHFNLGGLAVPEFWTQSL
jgi:hypothetical protein